MLRNLFSEVALAAVVLLVGFFEVAAAACEFGIRSVSFLLNPPAAC